MGKKSKGKKDKKSFNNTGGGWFNFEPNAKKSPQFTGKVRVSKTSFYLNTWIKAPKDCPKTKKAIKALKKAMKEEITEKGGKPVLSHSFKRV